jgi:hypothetical protein
MINHRHWLAIFGLGLGVLFLGPYMNGQTAGGTPGLGPGDALAVPDGWQTLAPGGQTWYAFDYGGDKSQVLVQMSVVPAGAASFAIWSPTDVVRWARGGPANPSGRGAANANYGGDLVWAGSSGEPGTWYVVVEAPGPAQAAFNLKVSGSGVSRHAAGTPTPVPTAAGLSVPAIATPVPAGVGAATAEADRYGLAYLHPWTPTPVPPAQYPADALPLPNGPQTLGVGQHVWYAFVYAGDRSSILMQMHADPPGSATFTVWSPDVLQRWWEGYFYTPTGRGTPNDAYHGDLIWLGGNIVKGKWYVVVEQKGSSPSAYTLTVSGTGVDRTLPPTPTPVPTATSLIGVQ